MAKHGSVGRPSMKDTSSTTATGPAPIGIPMNKMPLFASMEFGAQVFDPELSTFLKPHMIRIGRKARIDAHVKIEGGEGVTIGEGVHVSSFAHLNIGGGILRVGDYVALTSGVAVLSGTNTPAGQAMSSAAPPAMQVIQRTETIIDEFAFIGSRSVIYPGVHIGRYAIVKAGSIVTKDVPPYAVVAGSPAKFVQDRRDREDWGGWDNG